MLNFGLGFFFQSQARKSAADCVLVHGGLHGIKLKVNNGRKDKVQWVLTRKKWLNEMLLPFGGKLGKPKLHVH